MGDTIETHSIDPARLQSGQWCHRQQKTLGQGDISASYSADRIGMGQPIRKPFEWRGQLHACVSKTYLKGSVTAEAYRLVPPPVFPGKVVSYGERSREIHSAGYDDPQGFYHGMSVRHGGQTFVLAGPPLLFIEGQTAQLDLFG